MGLPNPHQGIIFERKNIYYDCSYKVAADYDFFLRYGYKILPLLKTEGYVYHDPGYSSENAELRDMEIANIIKKYFGYFPFLKFKIYSLIKSIIKGFLRYLIK